MCTHHSVDRRDHLGRGSVLLRGDSPTLAPLALVAYVAVINYRYLGGCGSAIDIALVAWIASLVVLYILGILGVTAFDAMGVPGT